MTTATGTGTATATFVALPRELRHHQGMTSAAELSSLSSTLKELYDRVSTMAESAQAGGDEDMARELFAVERSLAGTLRRLGRFTQTA